MPLLAVTPCCDRAERPKVTSVVLYSQPNPDVQSVSVLAFSRYRYGVDTNPAVQKLVDRYLDDFDEHLDALVATMQERIVEYQSVPPEEIRAFTQALVPAVVSQLPQLALNPLDVEPLAVVARRRAEQGFPPEALTRSLQIAAREMLREVDKLAAKDGVDAALMLQIHDLSWQFATDAAAVIAAINHEIAVETGRRESGRRADFLRAVLRGTLPPQQVKVQSGDFGLDAALPYYPVRARPSSSRDETRISLLIERTCATHTHRPVLAVIDGDVVAVTPKQPDEASSMLIAVGDPAELTSLAEPFRAATLALETGLAFGRTGVVTLEDLGALPAILLADDLAALLQKRYFGDLSTDEGANADIARTVWTWLECDQNVDQVAHRMHVHRNTVRYRLGRFKELTDLDLRQTNGLITAWLTLGRREAGGQL